jgi:hypothetical protein
LGGEGENEKRGEEVAEEWVHEKRFKAFTLPESDIRQRK